MNKSILSTAIILLINTISIYSQIPTIRANNNKASIRIGTQYYPEAWELTAHPQNDPDYISTEVDKEGTLFCFITDKDSIAFLVKRGEKYLFRVILNEKDTIWAQAKGGYPKAHFDVAYKKNNDGKVLIEVPPVYELVNIVMAITPTGIKDSNLIEHEDAYYQKVQDYFGSFKTHRAVTVMDSLLKADQYYDIKMDSYAFYLENGHLKKKSTYNRISWGSDNTIEPYIPLLHDFAKKTKFERFYKKNLPFYTGLIKAYQDTLGVPDMLKWLSINFPSVKKNCTKIIFSPLVNGNQSASGFDNDDFIEAQAHVNFPNFWYNPKTSKYTQKGFDLTRGDIVFTELNHGFENPEFENKPENQAAFNKIPFKLDVYAEKGKAASFYNNPLSCVEEYMNWALVSLRYVDFAPKKDLETLLQYRENFMVHQRGFTKFKAFNRFLVDIYTNRPKGKVVADLYPQIIKWFEDNNK